MLRLAGFRNGESLIRLHPVNSALSVAHFGFEDYSASFFSVSREMA
jgi:hypothetical protein